MKIQLVVLGVVTPCSDWGNSFPSLFPGTLKGIICTNKILQKTFTMTASPPQH